MCNWLGLGTAVPSCGRSTGLGLGELEGPWWSFSGPSSWRLGTATSCAFPEEIPGDAEVPGGWQLLLPVGLGSPGPRLEASQQVGRGNGVRAVEFCAQDAGFTCPPHGDRLLSRSLASDCYRWDGGLWFDLHQHLWGFQDILS